MIVITGATGTIGRLVVAELLATNCAVRALVRNPDRARELLGPDVDLVAGDFAHPGTAFAGATAALLLAPPGPALPAHDRALLAATVAVPNLVKLSAFGADAAVASTGWHQPGERDVMASGRRWTILRPAGFASNALAWLPAIRTGAPIAIATDPGRHAVIDPRDVAAVAAVALRSHELGGVTLTGPEALTGGEQVEILGRVLGRHLEIEAITPAVAVERMRAAGVAFADQVLSGFELVRSGGAATVTDTVARVLGRPARSFESWARDHVAAFRSD